MEQEFSDYSAEFWQNALRKRVLVHGGEDEALYNRAVALYTEKGGVYEHCYEISQPPPRLMLYAGDRLPEGTEPVDDRGTLHIAMGGSDDKVRAQIKTAYRTPVRIDRDDGVERDTAGVRIEVSEEQRWDRQRSDDEDENRPNNRSRDMLRILELPRELTEEEKAHLPEHVRKTRCFYIGTERQNTWGQLLDWKEFKQESPDAWQVFLQDHFSDKVTEALQAQRRSSKPRETAQKMCRKISPYGSYGCAVCG